MYVYIYMYIHIDRYVCENVKTSSGSLPSRFNVVTQRIPYSPFKVRPVWPESGFPGAWHRGEHFRQPTISNAACGQSLDSDKT